MVAVWRILSLMIGKFYLSWLLHSLSLGSEYSPSYTYFNGSLPPDWSQACWRNGENEPQG
jgi:hypothetical protein